MYLCNFHGVSNYISYQNHFLTAHEVPICMSVCLNTTAVSAHLFPLLQLRSQVLLRFPELRRTRLTSHLEGGPCATLSSLLASVGINTASPPCPCDCRHSTSSLAVHGAESCFLSMFLSGSWQRPSEEATSKARGCTCSFFQHSRAVPL